MRAIVMAACMAVLAIACQWNRVVYYHYEPVSDGWLDGDTMNFNLPVLEQAAHYQVSLEWRYTEAYPYRSLKLLVKNNLDDSLQWVSDTVTCFLRNENGIACGEGISAMYQLSVPLGEYASDGSQCASVHITHCMDTYSIEGLCDIGIKIERR